MNQSDWQSDRSPENLMSWSVKGIQIGINMTMEMPIAAVGYALIFMMFGGGIGGAILIFFIAKILGK